jgi:hypothetical protein
MFDTFRDIGKTTGYQSNKRKKIVLKPNSNHFAV